MEGGLFLGFWVWGFEGMVWLLSYEKGMFGVCCCWGVFLCFLLEE